MIIDYQASHMNFNQLLLLGLVFIPLIFMLINFEKEC